MLERAILFSAVPGEYNGERCTGEVMEGRDLRISTSLPGMWWVAGNFWQKNSLKNQLGNSWHAQETGCVMLLEPRWSFPPGSSSGLPPHSVCTSRTALTTRFHIEVFFLWFFPSPQVRGLALVFVSSHKAWYLINAVEFEETYEQWIWKGRLKPDCEFCWMVDQRILTGFFR